MGWELGPPEPAPLVKQHRHLVQRLHHISRASVGVLTGQRHSLRRGSTYGQLVPTPSVKMKAAGAA